VPVPATVHSRALFHAAAAIKPLKCPTGREEGEEEEEEEEEETFLKYVGAAATMHSRVVSRSSSNQATEVPDR
jgi:hypothetical protein